MANLPEPVPGRALEPRRPSFSPSLVRAAVSPTAIAAAAVGAGIGVADHSVIVALILAVGGWGARMGAAVVGGRRRARAATPRPAVLDPWSVPEPWRQLLGQAMGVQARFDHTVADWPPGPIRDHLMELQPRVWAEVGGLGAMAQRDAAAAGWNGASVAPGGATSEQLSEELRRVQADRAALPPAATGRAADLARREEALAAQLRARHNSAQAATAAQDRLRAALSRLDAAVTDLISTAADASAGPGRPGIGPAGVASALDGLSEELSSLRSAIAETAGPAAGPGPPGDPARS